MYKTNNLTGLKKLINTPSYVLSTLVATVLLTSCNSSSVVESEVQASEIRALLTRNAGSIENFTVPASNRDLPQPMLNGNPDPTFETTEAKRYLGKQIFHDPLRTVRIVTRFGGNLNTTSTGSCGSCHLGEAGSKAGQAINLSVGGEGIGYTNVDGEFIVRRRTRADLTSVRPEALFVGDTMVDELPTLTDIYINATTRVTSIGSPALGQLSLGDLDQTGRLDAVDSVGRMSPSVVGFAFNNRLLLDGFAGEADASDGGLNPFNHPAQENLTLLLLDAHRMLGSGPQGAQTQSAALLAIPAYVQLFREAFPTEATAADNAGDLNMLVNDVTIVRATATFLRTVVTRNTPWDRFLAGDNTALTQPQLRGAALFFTEATGGAGGAGCFGCHSGPMLNKQANDTDITGVGNFVEENFFNLGLDDHPIQALNREARRTRGLGNDFRDEGRKEITGNDNDAFKFRTLTLRQLKGSGNFMHGASFTTVRDVVEYFNAGVPQNEEAGRTATSRFTNPRGDGSQAGLGLNSNDVSALTDFIDNALFDPAFITHDPASSTDTLVLNAQDLTYSTNRTNLATLGATDGLPLSGLAQDNNDLLSRRDSGLEFLNVTASLDDVLTSRVQQQGVQEDSIRLTNNSTTTAIDTHLLVIVQNLLPVTAELTTVGTKMSAGNDPYIRVYLDNDSGTLQPGRSVDIQLNFSRPEGTVVNYDLDLQSGQGNP